MNEEQQIEIETRLAHHENMLNILNEAVTLQSKQIQQLEQICRLLLERIRTSGESVFRGSASEEIPPHY
jgi:SlyX protein